jgi:hypothetical protein
MTQKILGPEGSKRRKRFWLIPFVMAALAVVFYVSGAGAVLTNSPSKFESNDGNMVNNTANDTDWNCFVGNTGFHSATGINVGAACAVTSGALAQTDPVATTADNSWVNGQKMDNPCAQLTQNKNQGKNDFTYVATYSETRAADKHTFLYGATIRVSPNGSASENVELNQVAGTAACPITRTAGDRLLAFDYQNGGTSLDLHVLTWIAPNDPATTINESTLGGNDGVHCIISNDTLPCWGANILTPSGSSFEGQASQAAIAAGDNGINGEALVAGRFAEFGVDLTSALNASTTTCQTFAQTVWESRSSGSSFSSNPEDISIESKTISNCGGIIIRKVTSPSPDPATPDTAFSFSDNIASAADTFTLTNGTAKDFTSSVQAGSYSVSETPHAGYKLTNIDCSASTRTNGSTTTIGASGGFDTGDTSISIVLNAGDSIDCTYTNTLQTATLVTSDGAGTVTPATSVHDTATVTGSETTLNPSGTVTFYMCQFAAGGTEVCDGTTNVGTSIGTGTLGNGAGGVSTADSPNVNTAAAPLAPGRYCFRAEWPGDNNYPGALKEWGAASPATECFTVSKINTQTVTTPNQSGVSKSSITLGQSITDTAVVTGTSAGGDPTGTVTFHVCKVASPGVCDTGGDLVGDATTSVVALVSDGNAATFTSSATSVTFQPPTTGRYCFRGDYSGSTIYNTSSDSNVNECFTVTDTTGATSAQRWEPNDSATVTANNGATLNGTLSIQLYTGDNCGASSGAVVSGQLYQKTLTDATSSADRTVTSTNTTYTVAASASVSWLVTFTSTDANVAGTTHCEKSTFTITN